MKLTVVESAIVRKRKYLNGNVCFKLFADASVVVDVGRLCLARILVTRHSLGQRTDSLPDVHYLPVTHKRIQDIFSDWRGASAPT